MKIFLKCQTWVKYCFYGGKGNDNCISYQKPMPVDSYLFANKHQKSPISSYFFAKRPRRWFLTV